MEKILKEMIPHAFEIANAQYIKVNPKTNTAFWTKIKQDNKYKHYNTYTFSTQDIINLQIWHLKNSHINYNNKIW
jgi:hypothetical protein